MSAVTSVFSSRLSPAPSTAAELADAFRALKVTASVAAKAGADTASATAAIVWTRPRGRSGMADHFGIVRPAFDGIEPVAIRNGAGPPIFGVARLRRAAPRWHFAPAAVTT